MQDRSIICLPPIHIYQILQHIFFLREVFHDQSNSCSSFITPSEFLSRVLTTLSCISILNSPHTYITRLLAVNYKFPLLHISMSNSIYCSSPGKGTVVKLKLYLYFQMWGHEGIIKHSKCAQNPKKIKELMTDIGLTE